MLSCTMRSGTLVDPARGHETNSDQPVRLRLINVRGKRTCRLSLPCCLAPQLGQPGRNIGWLIARHTGVCGCCRETKEPLQCELCTRCKRGQLLGTQTRLIFGSICSTDACPRHVNFIDHIGNRQPISKISTGFCAPASQTFTAVTLCHRNHLLFDQ